MKLEKARPPSLRSAEAGDGLYDSGILHYNTFHGIRHMFAGVRAFLQIGIDFPPCHDRHRIGTGGMKPVHAVYVDLISFFFHGIDFDDLFMKLFGMTEIGEFLQHHLYGLTASAYDPHKLQRVGTDLLNIIIVELSKKIN